MPNHKIAVIRHETMELIVVPLDTVFEYRSQENKLAFRAELQSHAEDAGFTGSICLVWPYAGGMKFLAPRAAHEFFAGLSMAKLSAQVNMELVW